MWDDDLDYILYSYNVEVTDGGVTDVGNKAIVGWFTHMHGHVFVDSNENGKRDPGENSVPQFPLTVRERDNSTMDQAVNATSTDANGAYDIREAYPLGKWLVLEAFDTRYRTTGITYKGENENELHHQAGRSGRPELPADHRSRRRGRLGRQAVRRRHERRHRRHGQLRHDAQRARPCRRGVRELPARHPERGRPPLRHGAVQGDRPGRGQERVPAGQGDRAAPGPGPQ